MGLGCHQLLYLRHSSGVAVLTCHLCAAQMGTAANSRTLQAQQAMTQASKDPNAAKINVMADQKKLAGGFHGYKRTGSGRRRLLDLCQLISDAGKQL